MAREKKIDMVILGLLNHEELSGYDIKKRIDGAISFFWNGSFGNIYPALKDMEEKGLIRKSSCAGSGREKICYSITDGGKKALGDWVSDMRATNELKYETLLKLFFGSAKDKSVSISNIESFEESVKEDLNLLREYEKSLKDHLDDEDHMYFYLTVTFGIDSYETYLKWCEKAKKMLRSKAK